jgi:hypothetical protein
MMRTRDSIDVKSRFNSGRDINCISERIQRSRLLVFRAKAVILSSCGSSISQEADLCLRPGSKKDSINQLIALIKII